MDLKQCNKGNLTAHMTQIPAVYQNQQKGEAPLIKQVKAWKTKLTKLKSCSLPRCDWTHRYAALHWREKWARATWEEQNLITYARNSVSTVCRNSSSHDSSWNWEIWTDCPKRFARECPNLTNRVKACPTTGTQLSAFGENNSLHKQ